MAKHINRFERNESKAIFWFQFNPVWCENHRKMFNSIKFRSKADFFLLLKTFLSISLYIFGFTYITQSLGPSVSIYLYFSYFRDEWRKLWHKWQFFRKRKINARDLSRLKWFYKIITMPRMCECYAFTFVITSWRQSILKIQYINKN